MSNKLCDRQFVLKVIKSYYRVAVLRYRITVRV
jgi:hypothetical protein